MCFGYDTSNTLLGLVVRDDEEASGRMIIKLDDGRHLLSTECQYQLSGDWPTATDRSVCTQCKTEIMPAGEGTPCLCAADVRAEFNAVIDFAVQMGVVGADFLELWRLGDWDAIAVEFPEFKRPT